MSSVLNPREIDEQVGKRMRLRRLVLGNTMEEIGAQVGISFQQIQKYELDRSQISINRLYQIANALEVNISYFLEFMEHNVQAVADHAHDFNNASLDRDLARLINCYTSIKNDDLRRKVVNLVESLTQGSGQ